MTLVLDCSASETCEAASSGNSMSGSLVNTTLVPDELRTADALINDSRNCGAAVSYSASKPVRSSASPIVATVLYSETGSESHSTMT